MASDPHTEPPPTPALRIKAIQQLLQEKGLLPPGAIDKIVDAFEHKLGPEDRCERRGPRLDRSRLQETAAHERQSQLAAALARRPQHGPWRSVFDRSVRSSVFIAPRPSFPMASSGGHGRHRSDGFALWIKAEDASDPVLFAGIRKFRGGAEVTFEGSFGFSGDMASKGWQRAAHREIDDRLSLPAQPVHTHARAEPLARGEIARIDIALRQHATRFRKGDVLQVNLRANWHFPRDPLFGQFPTFYAPSRKGNWVLPSGGEYDSHLLFGSRAITAI